jgi:hypothetical protein
MSKTMLPAERFAPAALICGLEFLPTIIRERSHDKRRSLDLWLGHQVRY